jgi:hypothetical protein
VQATLLAFLLASYLLKKPQLETGWGMDMGQTGGQTGDMGQTKDKQGKQL